MQVVAKKYSLDFVLQEALIEGFAYDQFAVPLLEETKKLCLAADAVHAALKKGCRIVDIAGGRGKIVSTAAMGDTITALL